MALDFQTISIPFGRGIDTKQDDKLVDEGVLVQLENGVFRKGGPRGGTITKRYGVSDLSQGIFGGTTSIVAGEALATYDDELLLFGSETVYSWSESLNAWINKGSFTTTNISNNFIIKNQYTQSNPDSATNDGVTVYVWEDSRGGIRGSIVDESSGTVIVSDTQINATGSKPRCIAAGTFIFIIYIDSANLVLCKVPVGQPAFGTPANMRTNVNTTYPHFDCIKINSHVVIAYSNSSPAISLFYLSNTGFVSPATLPSLISVAETAMNCLGIAKRDDDTEIYVAYHNTSAGIRCFARDSSFVQIFAATTVENDTTNTYGQITGCNSNTTTDAIRWYYQKNSSTDKPNTSVRQNTITNAGVAGTAADFKRSVGLGGKAFERNDITYVMVARESDEQSCFFLCNESGSVISQILYGDGGGLRTSTTLPCPVSLSSSQIFYSVSRATQLVAEGDKIFTVKGVNRTDFTFASLPNLKNLQLGKNLHIPSGSLFIYDGNTITESGFYLYPEGTVVDDKRFRVTKKQDGTAGLPEISHVSFMHGDKIEGGQYWLITSAVPTDYYIWYQKDAVGTDPAVAGRTGVEVDILSTDNADSVAAKTKTALDAIGGAPFTTTRNNHSLVITNAANAAVTDTSNGTMGLSGHSVSVTTPGSGGAAEVTSIVCVAGSLYTTGEYMFLNAASDSKEYYLWINKDSAGGDPKITGKVGIEIAIGAASTATQVGDAFAAAIDPLADFSAANVTGTVTVTNAANGDTTDAKNVTMTTATAGAIGDGTYGVAVIYQWEDARGQIHRSAPFYRTAEVNGELGRGKLTSEIPPLRITNKSNVIMHVYRTEANGQVYYRVSSFSSPVRSVTTTDKVIFTDRLNDSEILNREILYTTGGVIENIAPVAPQLAIVHNKRLIVKGDEDNTLWYSKTQRDGQGMAFSDSFTLNIDASGGPVTALGSLDNYLIIFKESEIRAIAGSGPNDAGLQNDFTDDQLVTTDVGCTNPKSIVRYDKGLLFETTKGIYLLNRSLEVSYVGAAVEDFNDLTITAATLLADSNEVRFISSDGVCLVYNYFFVDEFGVGQWSTLTNHLAVDAIIWNDTYHHLKSNGLVRYEDSSTYSDNGASVVMKLKTAWIKLGQLQGFKRIRRAALLGDYKSAHTFLVEIAYDYEPVISDTISWSPNSIINTGLYGDDSPYGSGTPYGGISDTVYQFRFHHPRQKCEAVQYTIRDSMSGTYGESYSLSDLSLEVALKRGLNKMRAAKTL